MLSPRELQVARLCAAAVPWKVMARELGISVRTLYTYGHRALEKHGMDQDGGSLQVKLAVLWIKEYAASPPKG